MKSSFGKLRKFVQKIDSKDKRQIQPSAKLDELAQAAQDMQDMKNCYDSLLSAAAAMSNSAYEFSESLREMGSSLLEKTTLRDDEKSGRIFSMLGILQFELQKLVDRYRSHVILTITNPSESLLNELRTVEEMKRQCDEKRGVYEYMVAQQREKGRSKSGKGERTTMQQLQAAHDEYDEAATLCIFRLKSLKQGQSRSLLTQAARHHAAQLNLFRKGLVSLEAVEPHIRQATEQQHIDYQFTGLEEDDHGDGENDGDNEYRDNDFGELSFDYRPKDVSASRNSMEEDEVGHSSPRTSRMEYAVINSEKNHDDLKFPSRDPRISSYSAPIFAEKKFDPAERVRQLQLSSKEKSNTYVLPTPDARGLLTSKPSSSLETMLGGESHNWRHTTPLEKKKLKIDSVDDNLLGYNVSNSESVDKESGTTSTSTKLPLPLAGVSLPQIDTYNMPDAKNFKRLAFSGPLTSKPYSTKPVSSASVYVSPTELPQLVSEKFSRSPIRQPSSSPKVSPSASPPLVSSPKISELHELPRPPGSSATKSAKTPAFAASPLPIPPMIFPRSFSIPSNSPRTKTLQVRKKLESIRVAEKIEEVASPPLTPISLSNIKSASQSGPIRGM